VTGLAGKRLQHLREGVEEMMEARLPFVSEVLDTKTAGMYLFCNCLYFVIYYYFCLLVFICLFVFIGFYLFVYLFMFIVYVFIVFIVYVFIVYVFIVYVFIVYVFIVYVFICLCVYLFICCRTSEASPPNNKSGYPTYRYHQERKESEVNVC
jgi:hypothetical protein